MLLIKFNIKYMKFSFFFICIISTIFYAAAQRHSLSTPSSKESMFLNSNQAYSNTTVAWKFCRYDSVGLNGKVVSSSLYQDESWMRAVVPGTVLTSLVKNHVYPDPYYGDVNKRTKKIIPDIADVGRDFYHYWFRTKFTVPSNFTGKIIWLKLHGVNYRAEIWLNGKKLGMMAGMFNSAQFDITEFVHRKDENILAINVLPVDVPGTEWIEE